MQSFINWSQTKFEAILLVLWSFSTAVFFLAWLIFCLTLLIFCPQKQNKQVTPGEHAFLLEPLILIDFSYAIQIHQNCFGQIKSRCGERFLEFDPHTPFHLPLPLDVPSHFSPPTHLLLRPLPRLIAPPVTERPIPPCPPRWTHDPDAKLKLASSKQ